MKGKAIYKILAAVYLLSSCQAKDIEYPIIQDQYLEVRISANELTLPEVDQNTRSNEIINENTINEVELIVFNGDDTYFSRKTVIDNKVALEHTADKRTIYVLANAKERIDAASSSWVAGTTTITEVLESLYQERGATIMPQLPFAMYAKLIFPNGINNNSAITSNGTNTGQPLLLKRNIAKISVTVGAELAPNFTLLRYMLCDVPKTGFIINSTVRESANKDNYDLINATVPMYSFVATQNTTMIVEAETENGIRYFKVAIKESAAQGAIGLKQNNWYKINIISKSGIGFTTVEDAINGHVLDDVSTTLEVLDITMHDFLFGSDYFIATSNSVYEQYGHKIGDNYYEICKVRLANTVANEEILGNTSIEVISGDMELHPTTISEISSAKNHTTYSILTKFSASSVSGIIRIKYKEVSKDLRIKVEPQQDLRKDQFIEIPEAVFGNIVTTGDMHWCGINDVKIFTENNEFDANTEVGVTLYLTVKANQNLFESRETEARFGRTKTGMAKVCIYQNPDNNLIYLSDDGILSVGNASKATNEKMMFFKFGSVIGVNNFTNGNAWDNSYIRFNPSNYLVGQDITKYDNSFELPGIPCYNDNDMSQMMSVSASNYHNATNIRKGKGDPCILVGLTANQIKLMSDSELNNYVSGYRMPTNSEQLSFSGLPGNDNNYPLHWWAEDDANSPEKGRAGGEFPRRNGFLGYFLPATGYITPEGKRYLNGLNGYYWTNYVAETNPGWGESPFCLEFNNTHVNPANGQGYFSEGMPIRCVRIR